MSLLGQVTPFGNRSVNDSKGSEATDPDLVVCVGFSVRHDQKQTVAFRPDAVVRGHAAERLLLARSHLRLTARHMSVRTS
jgi:hypothetical protein